MHHHHILGGKSIQGCDLLLYIVRSGHKYLYMDLYIFRSGMLNCLDILNQIYIPVDSLVPFPHNLANKSMQAVSLLLCIESMVHRVKGHKGLQKQEM